MFFWGKRQWQDTVEQFPELKKKSSVSGSPIVDFWHAHQAWLAKTRRKPDDILFATSFPIVNHPMGKEYFYRSINDAAPDALKEFKAEFDQDAEIQQLGLDLYQDLLVKLATAFPQRTIYLRPHPTEDQDVWNRIKHQHQNIVFARDGEIGSWFDKVGYFIHYNSTTAIQASFYGLDIYSLLPGDRTGIDARFSNQCASSPLNAIPVRPSSKTFQTTLHRRRHYNHLAVSVNFWKMLSRAMSSAGRARSSRS